MRTTPLRRWAPAMLAIGLLAGCGSGSATTTTTAPPQTAQTTTTTLPRTANGTTAPTGTTGPASRASAAAVAKCRATLAARTDISAASRKALVTLCDQSAGKNAVQIRAAASALCEKVVNSSSLPAASKQEALIACRTV